MSPFWYKYPKVHFGLRWRYRLMSRYRQLVAPTTGLQPQARLR